MNLMCRLLALILCLVTASVLTDARNPGVRIKLSRKGLSYVANEFVDEWISKFRRERLRSLHGSSSLLGNDATYDITNIHISECSEPIFKMQTKNVLEIHLSFPSIKLSADWHYKYRLAFIPISDSGNLDIIFKDISLAVVVALGADIHGRPSLSLKSYDTHIGDTDLTIHGGASVLYNLFTSYLESIIRSRLQSKMSDRIKEIVKKTGKNLEKMKVQTRLHFLNGDFSLTSAPVLQEESLEFPLKGEFYLYDNKDETPFEPQPMKGLPRHDKMISLYLSDYVIKSMGYALMKRGGHLTRYNMAAEELLSYQKYVPNLKQLLELPPRYPNSSLELEIYMTKQPLFVMRNGTILVILRGTMDFRLRLSNKTFVDWFSEDLKMVIFLNVALNKEKLTAAITRFRLFTSVKDPYIKSDLVTGWKFMAKVIAEMFIIPHLNALGSTGLSLPRIPYLTLVNPELFIMNGYLGFLTDAEYDPVD